MNPLEWLFATDPQSAMRIQGGNNVPRSVPVPAQRPATRASLPGGSFTPARVPTAQIPEMGIPVPAQKPMGGGLGAGSPGEVKRGPDGKTYQYAETKGMAGATGDWGWIPVTPPQEPPQADMAMPIAQTTSQPSEGPLEALLMGGGSEPLTWKDRVRAFGAGAGAGGSTGGDPFRAFGQGFGGASGYYDARDKAELAKAVELRKMRLSEQLAQNKLKTGGVSYGKSPVWGTDPENGKAVLGVIGDDGSFKKVDTSGVDLSTGVEKIDAGTHWVLQDGRSGQFIGTVPKENYKESFDKSAGGAAGKARGEAIALYNEMKSHLPGLETVVAELEVLADEATYTKAGQTYDFFRKELGLDPREAAVARSDYIAKVDNQVLPLLRQTFGAQFTVQEGESLRATLGDPNKTPEEKKRVLRAFIEQKKRNIEAQAMQAAIGSPAAAGGASVSDAPDGGAATDGVTDYTDYFGTE